MTNYRETYMNRGRSLIALISASLILALVIATPGQAQDKLGAKKVMDGSWKVIVTPGPAPLPLPPSIEGIITYVPGGGLVESDSLAVPGSVAGSGQGAWEATGPREFNLTFTKYLFTTQGVFQGSVRITERIKRDPNDTEYTGEGSMVVLSPTGTPILTIALTSHATRIIAEAQ